MDLLRKLYEIPFRSSQEQIEVNEVVFHRIILTQFSPYFDNIDKQAEILSEYSTPCLKILKNIMYGINNIDTLVNQPDRKDGLAMFTDDIPSLPEGVTVEILIELYQLLDFLCVDNSEKILKYIRNTKSLPALQFFISRYHPTDCTAYNSIIYILHDTKIPHDDIYDSFEDKNLLAYILFNNYTSVLRGFSYPTECKLLTWVISSSRNLDNLEEIYQAEPNMFCTDILGYFLIYIEQYKKARELFDTNWQVNKFSFSLDNLAYCIERGYGGPRDVRKSIQLWEQNSTENKNLASIFNHNVLTKKSLDISRTNWGENKCVPSLDHILEFFRDENLARWACSLYKNNMRYIQLLGYICFWFGETEEKRLEGAKLLKQASDAGTHTCYLVYLDHEYTRTGNITLIQQAKNIAENFWKSHQDLHSLSILTTILEKYIPSVKKHKRKIRAEKMLKNLCQKRKILEAEYTS